MKVKRLEQAEEVKALKMLLAECDATITNLREKNATLEHNVNVLQRLVFGKSSERRAQGPETSEHAAQGHLFYAELVAEAERVARDHGVEGAIELTSPATPKKQGRRRREFPEHLPRIQSSYELPEDQRRCSCGGSLHGIGWEESRELERIEKTLVHLIRRAKYGCRSCGEMVRTAPGPDRVIEKGLLGPGFLAHVICERFDNHMPYYRLEKKYAAEGLDLSRSVLERSAARCAELLEPVYKELKRQVLVGGLIFTDDTPVTIARPHRGGGSRLGRVWCYVDQADQVVYDFTESRKRDGPLEFLSKFAGFIHADAYPGYDALYLPGKGVEVGCWAHTRRKFLEAEVSEPDLAREAVARIRALYAIERAGKGLDPEQRRELRQREAVPRLTELHAWLGAAEAKVLPRSPMARAVGYALRQWGALTCYVRDGRLEIDNNRAERAMRPIAVGRKNWLFFQAEGGGRTAVILMSLMRSAKAAGLNPQVYLRDILLRIARESDIEKLVPLGWREHFAAEVESERQAAVKKILES